MNELVAAVSTGLVTFIATNIDDIVILLIFFSQVNHNFRPQHIVMGQYLGLTVLIILSLPGFFGGLILPPNLIGLLGLLPIGIGISSLVNRQEDVVEEMIPASPQSEAAITTSFLSPQTYSVASITIANGSDNISIYVPLFANSNLESFLVIIGLFFLLLGVWCYIAYKLTHQKTIANCLTSYGNDIVPFVLLVLGAFIVLKSEALSLIKLVGTCFCLMILLKNDDNRQEIEKN
jgi:cadmium resistance transport/sequestration family protein